MLDFVDKALREVGGVVASVDRMARQEVKDLKWAFLLRRVIAREIFYSGVILAIDAFAVLFGPVEERLMD
jgi:hypothetical protein